MPSYFCVLTAKHAAALRTDSNRLETNIRSLEQNDVAVVQAAGNKGVEVDKHSNIVSGQSWVRCKRAHGTSVYTKMPDID